MKSQLRKLRDLALSKHGAKESAFPQEIEENISSDMQAYTKALEDMRTRYEVFLTSGQLISGAAYDFSRALSDMASCMIETFGEVLGDKIGETFGMLANVQFEISKLLELFTRHVSQSIISPSERIISEIMQIEDVKDKYYENRRVYDEFWMEKHKEKPNKGKENYPEERLMVAKKAMKEQFNAIQNRMKSLAQDQSNCLFSQVIMYHMSQMHFFSKGLETVNAMEPVMKQLAEESNMDRSLLFEQIESGRLDITDDDLHENEIEINLVAGLPSQVRSSPSSKLKVIQIKPQGNSKSAPLAATFHNRKGGNINVGQRTDEKVSGYVLPSPLEVKSSLATPSPIQEPKATTYLGTSKGFLVDSNKTAGFSVEQSAKDKITEVDGRCTLSAPLKSSPPAYRSNSPPRHNSRGGKKLGHEDYIIPLYKSEAVQASITSNTNSAPLPKYPPAMVSSPLIFELHKLPPPPRPGSVIAHSAPLGVRVEESPLRFELASRSRSPPPPPPPLPPPLTRVMSRSFSASSAHYTRDSYCASNASNVESMNSSNMSSCSSQE